MGLKGNVKKKVVRSKETNCFHISTLRQTPWRIAVVSFEVVILQISVLVDLVTHLVTTVSESHSDKYTAFPVAVSQSKPGERF